jgi:hypothetical protein
LCLTRPLWIRFRHEGGCRGSRRASRSSSSSTGEAAAHAVLSSPRPSRQMRIASNRLVFTRMPPWCRHVLACLSLFRYPSIPFATPLSLSLPLYRYASILSRAVAVASSRYPPGPSTTVRLLRICTKHDWYVSAGGEHAQDASTLKPPLVGGQSSNSLTWQLPATPAPRASDWARATAAALPIDGEPCCQRMILLVWCDNMQHVDVLPAPSLAHVGPIEVSCAH